MNDDNFTPDPDGFGVETIIVLLIVILIALFIAFVQLHCK